MMLSWSLRRSLLAIALAAALLAEAAPNVDSGINPYSAAQGLINLSNKTWEVGTAAQSLLELYDPELSVFGSDPFPGGKIPKADPESTFALRYAKQFISTRGQVLAGDVEDNAVGDPASLGVSALLLGQTEGGYLEAVDRQADFLLRVAPKYSNGAISHRPDVPEVWADNMAMSMPFLAYLAVQKNDLGLMVETFNQCRLQRDVLKVSWFLNWRHIIGPSGSGSRDEGLWSTGNGWAGYGMARVLHTMQKWPRSAGMTDEARQLKLWIQEILDGAMLSGLDDGLLRNYLNEADWFGEATGTGLLTALAYRMAVNDPGMFPAERYITWADKNREALGRHQRSGAGGILSPVVNPYDWKDRNKFTRGSPEAQAFVVNLHAAYRDCILAEVCKESASSPQPSLIVSATGIGPFQWLTELGMPLTYSDKPVPTTPACSTIRPSCDAPGCAGSFDDLGDVPYGKCTEGPLRGCECLATPRSCPPRPGCDDKGCDGSFDKLGDVPYAKCRGNYRDCECTPTARSCGPRASCDAHGCDGSFNGLGEVSFGKCRGNFVGCECLATERSCGPMASCDAGGCRGSFNNLGNVKFPQCQGNFVGCNCTATEQACGPRLSCDLNGCRGTFNGLGIVKYAQCSGNFEGCECTATATTCGPRASCDFNNCGGDFSLQTGRARCTRAFENCECIPTQNTCGQRQSCDSGNCQGGFSGSELVIPKCQNFFQPCQCNATPNTCGAPQPCDRNSCNGQYNLRDGKAYCTGNFVGCECRGVTATCGRPRSCDEGNCAGSFWGNVPDPQCTNFFHGCRCLPTDRTCGEQQRCDLNGCNGVYDSVGVARCRGNFFNCRCKAVAATCPPAILCSQCNGAFLNGVARCRERFPNCVCLMSAPICPKKFCWDEGCEGSRNVDPGWTCKNLWRGCPCEPPGWTGGEDPNPNLPVPPPPPQPVAEWYCLGTHEETFGLATPAPSTTQKLWGLFATNMLTGRAVGELWDRSGVSPRQVEGLCGARFAGNQVVCHGDITKQCSGYGVATFAGRRCRTRCPRDDGSNEHCSQWSLLPRGPRGGPILTNWDHMDLICNVI